MTKIKRIATAYRYTENKAVLQSVQFYSDGTYQITERVRRDDDSFAIENFAKSC